MRVYVDRLVFLDLYPICYLVNSLLLVLGLLILLYMKVHLFLWLYFLLCYFLVVFLVLLVFLEAHFLLRSCLLLLEIQLHRYNLLGIQVFLIFLYIHLYILFVSSLDMWHCLDARHLWCWKSVIVTGKQIGRASCRERVLRLV